MAGGGLDLGKLEDEAGKAMPKEAADEVQRAGSKGEIPTWGQGSGDVRVTHRLDRSRLPASSPMNTIRLGKSGRAPEAASEGSGRQTHPGDQSGHPAVPVRLRPRQSCFDDWANLLLEQATLAEGGQLDDPAGFVKRNNDPMLAWPAPVNKALSTSSENAEVSAVSNGRR